MSLKIKEPEESEEDRLDRWIFRNNPYKKDDMPQSNEAYRIGCLAMYEHMKHGMPDRQVIKHIVTLAIRNMDKTYYNSDIESMVNDIIDKY